MQRPDEVKLSPQDGEALRTRLAGDALTADDRRVLDLVLQWYFWLLFALQEARFSLKRLRAMVFGDRTKKRPQKQSSGEGVSNLLILCQTARPNSYRLMNSPITTSCMRFVLEKHIPTV